MFGRNQNSNVYSRCIQSCRCSPLLNIVDHYWRIIFRYCTIPNYYIPHTFLQVYRFELQIPLTMRLNVTVLLHRRIRMLHPSGWIPESIWTYMHRIAVYFAAHSKVGDKRKNTNEQFWWRKLSNSSKFVTFVDLASHWEDQSCKTFTEVELNRWLVRTIFYQK